MRDLATLALSPDWSTADAVERYRDADLAGTIDSYEAGIAPLEQFNMLPDDQGVFDEPMGRVREALKLIGMKISPTMSIEQCATWIAAVTLALADFPPKVIIQAARTAIRVPMSYLNEVDGHVRLEAEKVMERHRTALRRLRAMQAEIARAAAPPPALPAPDEPWVPTDEELRRMSPHVRSLGLSAGFITQAQLDAADALARDEAA